MVKLVLTPRLNVASDVRARLPDRVAVLPEAGSSTPPAPKVTALSKLTLLPSSKVPPVTFKAPDDNTLSSLTARVPADTLMPPLHAASLPVLDKVRMPLANLVNVPVPDTKPDKVTAFALLTVPPLLPRLIALSMVTLLPITDKVPPFMAKLPVPRLPSPPIAKVPPVIVVVPV